MNEVEVLPSLLAYFRPLASRVDDDAGQVTLLTPEVNVLALNATYLMGETSAKMRSRLVASTRAVPGRDVGGLRVGEYVRQVTQAGPESGVVVEQVSRLHVGEWAAVLAQAYDTPDWTSALARHFARKLEGERDSVLLMAYQQGRAVGALLWRAGAAHLWGTLKETAAAPLLNAASELGGSALWVSLPDSSSLHLPQFQVVQFTLVGPGRSARRSPARPR